MKQALTISWWQFAGAILLMIGWMVGDYILLLHLDAAILDCLPGDSRSSRAGAFEAIVCHPLLLGKGPLGWLAVAWFWAPLIAIWLWLRGR